MKSFSDVANENSPSSFDNTFKEVDEYELPEDPEAENQIKISGITTDQLIDMCFQGIELRTHKGDYFTRTFLAQSINSAINTAEQLFDITLTHQVVEDELHDYEGRNINEYSYTSLFLRPVKKINRLTYKVGNSDIMDIPLKWIQLDKKGGAITIFPTSGSIQPLVPAIGGAFPYFGTAGYMPMGLSVSYEAGMDKEEIPSNLLDYIFKKAALSVFEVWGDQILMPGIANNSLSIDGVSQSMGSTKAAQSSGAAGRIAEYRQDIQDLTVALRKHFARINVAVL